MPGLNQASGGKEREDRPGGPSFTKRHGGGSSLGNLLGFVLLALAASNDTSVTATGGSGHEPISDTGLSRDGDPQDGDRSELDVSVRRRQEAGQSASGGSGGASTASASGGNVGTVSTGGSSASLGDLGQFELHRRLSAKTGIGVESLDRPHRHRQPGEVRQLVAELKNTPDVGVGSTGLGAMSRHQQPGFDLER